MREKRYKKLDFRRFAILIALCMIAALLLGYTVALYTVDRGMMIVSFLDVGQGDAELVSLPDGGHILIDGGDEGSGEYVLRPYLTKKGIRKLDAVFLSHCHSDHVMGVIELLESGYPIECLYLCKGALDGAELASRLHSALAQGAVEIKWLEGGEALRFGRAELLNLSLSAAETGEDENDRSMVLRLQYGETSFLFTGDISTKAEEGLLDRPEIQSDVLKVAHHGSGSSSGIAFLDAVRPRYAVIEVADGNPYHLPSEKALRRMARGGLIPLRTDLDGTVEFVVTENGIRRIRTTRAR